MAAPTSGSTPRLVAYCDTHTWSRPGKKQPDYDATFFDRWLPLTRLTESGQRVSHIMLGQWWYAPDSHPNTLCLNDFSWDKSNAGNPLANFGNPPFGDQLNDKVWKEAREVQAKGIKILTQLTFFWEKDKFGQPDGELNEEVYKLLHHMLSTLKFDGVDLDVEPQDDRRWTTNKQIIELIKRLKKDFGTDFLITMAPGGRELLDKGDANYDHLSGVYYKGLYQQLQSEHLESYIDWFNVQLYNSWGRLTLSDFERFMKAGTNDIVYPAHKLVMNVCTNPLIVPDRSEWIQKADLDKNLREILHAHPDMGGITCSDWFNAVLEERPHDGEDDPDAGFKHILHPEKWFQFVYKILYG